VKRFTETQKWADPWFMDLPAKWKLFWVYLLDNCDNAGVWTPNMRLAAVQIGENFEAAEALRVFTDRIEALPNGKWHITKFVEFQFGELSDSCKPHKSIKNLMEKHGLAGSSKGYPYPLDTLQEKEEEKEQEQEQEQDKDQDKDAPKRKKPAKTDEPELNVTSTTASLLNGIEAKIQSLKPEWRIALTYAEQTCLRDNLRSVESITEEDWAILRDFLAAKVDKAEGFWQPWSRSKFVETIGDVHISALRWASKNRRVRKEGWK
jgi:hypothetical protein